MTRGTTNNAKEMKMLLRKYPKTSGAGRFIPYFVPVTILGREVRQEPCTGKASRVEDVRDAAGNLVDQIVHETWEKGMRDVEYVLVRECGKKPAWHYAEDVVIAPS